MIEIVKEAAEKAGGVSALALRLGIKHPALYKWGKIPAERVLKIEEVTGISRYRQRPDIYGEQPK